MRAIWFWFFLPALCSGGPRFPVTFEANRGQAPPDVRYIARSGKLTSFLRANSASISLAGNPVHMHFDGARPNANLKPLDVLPTVSNFLHGRDPSRWISGVPHYARVRAHGVYPKIDLLYYDNDGALELDWELTPGADPDSIRLRFDERVHIAPDGSLTFDLAGGAIRQSPPIAYQEIGGARVPVQCHYTKVARDLVGFRLGAYDRSRPLIIDPAVEYASYNGGPGAEEGNGVAIDPSGNLYICGTALVGAGPASSRVDAFVMQYLPSRNLIGVYTFLGGDAEDGCHAITTDGSSNLYLTGFTRSANFPIRNPAQIGTGGPLGDVFVTRLDSDARTIVSSTYLAGSGAELGRQIAVDSRGAILVAGTTTSTNFPLKGAIQSTKPPDIDTAFLTKLAPTGDSIVFSTYLGGTGETAAYGLAVDRSGNPIVAGSTRSADFVVKDALQATTTGNPSGYLSKFSADGSSILFSTFLGGRNSTIARSVVIDSSNNIYVGGSTSSPDFPVKDAVQPTFGGGPSDGFLMKLNSSASQIVYATYFGGDAEDVITGIATDFAGTLGFTGNTKSANIRLVDSAQRPQEGWDAFGARLSANGDRILYSAIVAGTEDDESNALAMDSSSAFWIAGTTRSPDLRTVNAAQPERNGRSDTFFAKFSSVGQPLAATLALNKRTLEFEALPGQPLPSAQTIEVGVAPGSPQTNFVANPVFGPIVGSWFTINPSQGTTPASLSVLVNPSGLAPGRYTATVEVTPPLGSIVTFTVNLRVASPAAFLFAATGTLTPGSNDTMVTVVGAGFVNGAQVQIMDPSKTVTTRPALSVTPNQISVFIPAALLARPGVLQLQVTNPDSVASNAVTVLVGRPLPEFTRAGIVSAASLTGEWIAPGQLITIFGANLGPITGRTVQPLAGTLATEAEEVRVLFDGGAAPIQYVSDRQINVIVPAAVASKAQTEISVAHKGLVSAGTILLPVRAAAPGLFTQTGTGQGQGAILNQNGSVNNAQNPAARGSVVVLYITGAGLLTTVREDGSIATGLVGPRLPVSVWIDGKPSEVIYSGTAPPLLESVLQVNVRVPESATPSVAAPVVLRSGDIEMPARATIAIR